VDCWQTAASWTLRQRPVPGIATSVLCSSVFAVDKPCLQAPNQKGVGVLGGSRPKAACLWSAMCFVVGEIALQANSPTPPCGHPSSEGTGPQNPLLGGLCCSRSDPRGVTCRSRQGWVCKALGNGWVALQARFTHPALRAPLRGGDDASESPLGRPVLFAQRPQGGNLSK